MATPSVTPPPLPIYARSIEEIPGTWWVIQSRPQHEKKIANYLANVGFGYCLPWEAVTVYVGRTRERRMQERVLYRDYVFFSAKTEMERFAVQNSEDLRNSLRSRTMIRVVDQQALVRKLSFVNGLLGTGSIMWDYEPHEGDEVVVTHGPWMNRTGKVCEPLVRRARDGVLYAAIEIETLGRKVCCEIPRDFLERAA